MLDSKIIFQSFLIFEIYFCLNKSRSFHKTKQKLFAWKSQARLITKTYHLWYWQLHDIFFILNASQTHLPNIDWRPWYVVNGTKGPWQMIWVLKKKSQNILSLFQVLVYITFSVSNKAVGVAWRHKLNPMQDQKDPKSKGALLARWFWSQLVDSKKIVHLRCMYQIL